MFKLISLKCIGFKRLNIPKPIEFPNGRLLIYGRNESGKSTIMEAIHYALYGQGLRPHKRASKDDLLNYSLPKAIVELKFTIDDNQYTVSRVLRRKGTTIHELIIETPDGKKNRTTGARKVNKLILQELHGIDSEALLNSCLMEQKELGKLESSSRIDRIRAMTSLLNLEAFIEGQQALNKTEKILERTNLETVNSLERARQAKKLYDEAIQKLEQAQASIKTIEQTLNKLTKRINELDKILVTIDEIKKIDNNIKEQEALLEGKQGEITRIIDSLKDAIKAEKLAKEIEKKLPVSRLKLNKAKRKVNALDSIIQLQNQLDNAYKEAERAKERLKDASDQVEEAKTAKKRMNNLNNQIQEIEPVKKVQTLQPSIEKLSQSLNETKTEAARLEKKELELKSQLDALKDVDNHINQLEQQEQTLQSNKASFSRKRTMGLVSTATGLIVSIATIVFPYAVALGLPLIIIGLLFAWRNSPATVNAQLDSIRNEREDVLGDKARIDDYTNQLEETQKDKKKQEDTASNSREELCQVLSQLPSKPREYRSIFKTDQPPIDFLTPFRNAIQQDLQSYTKLSTKRDETIKTATELKKRQQTLQEQTTNQKKALTNIKSFEESKRDIEKNEQISLNQEQELRLAKDNLQKTVQEFTVQLKNAHERSSEKENLEKDHTKIQEFIQTLQINIKKSTKIKTRLQEKINIDLAEEETLRDEKDNLQNETAGLKTKKQERKDDIEESKKTIENNKELNEEYPGLVEKDDKEKFEIKSMNMAIKLLEATRDGIVAGVKGHIENNMMRFMPSLTANRYNMAQIDEKDYRIEVYDREARRWRGKGVFSGATQDQFSLALRLAFALSTIPSSRGARPGFIFLDEPLSGFDQQRKEGLLNLLRGELAKNFEQIIIISHLEELKNEFPEQIQLEAGKVVTE